MIGYTAVLRRFPPIFRISRRSGEPYTVTAFKTIRARAEKRKGGPKALARLGDDRILAEMTRRVFCAGFTGKPASMVGADD